MAFPDRLQLGYREGKRNSLGSSRLAYYLTNGLEAVGQIKDGQQNNLFIKTLRSLQKDGYVFKGASLPDSKFVVALRDPKFDEIRPQKGVPVIILNFSPNSLTTPIYHYGLEPLNPYTDGEVHIKPFLSIQLFLLRPHSLKMVSSPIAYTQKDLKLEVSQQQAGSIYNGRLDEPQWLLTFPDGDSFLLELQNVTTKAGFSELTDETLFQKNILEQWEQWLKNIKNLRRGVVEETLDRYLDGRNY